MGTPWRRKVTPSMIAAADAIARTRGVAPVIVRKATPAELADMAAASDRKRDVIRRAGAGAGYRRRTYGTGELIPTPLIRQSRGALRRRERAQFFGQLPTSRDGGD